MAQFFGEEFLHELRSRLDIVSIVEQYVTLKRSSSSSMVGLCPFHNEKTPSFHVDGQKQLFYCFGCNAGGDAITFLMKMQNMSYPEAVTYLAESVGMTVPTRDTFDSEITHLRKTILEMNRRAARYFHECLFQSEGKAALDYITGRGLTKNTIIRFGIGYSPAGWSGLYDKLREWGYKDEQIKASGLVVVSEREKGTTKLFDRFRGRVMFPIIDANGNVIGFGGRSMDPNDPAKYLNSPEVITFRKGNNLYAMNYAKATKRDCLILCEGYMDVIAMHQAGFDNAVAGLGTALTPEQGRLLKKYTDRVVLCYDNDEAGRKATQRSMQVLSSLDLQVRVLTLRGGKDPDEIIKKEGRAFFQALVDGSETGVDFRLNEILRRYDLSVDSERVQCSGEVFDLLASLRQDAQREIYSSRAAKMLTLSDDTVKREVAKRLRNLERLRKKQQEKDENNRLRGVGDRINPQRMTHLKAARAEEDLISVLLAFPEKANKICEQISPEDFVTDFNRRVFMALLEQIRENPTATEPGLLLSQYFQPDEMGRIVSFISSCDAINADDKEILRAATVLKEEKRRIDQRAAGGDQAFAENLKRLREQRKTKE
ncbi:MAG: DNA primase [Clostridia bacterium]|nr:DNA primase [Clostridia bacterium]MBQ5820984.1 DNA primase [Clostridia bacterium]